MSYNEHFMNMAIELAKECALQDEVPVGCVVVKDGKVIGASGNRKERENNAICHAEIIALSQATKSVGNWWLEDCDVYVTLEPCVMCAGAMIHSRIRTLYFGAYDEKTGACGSKLNLFEQGLFNHTVLVSGGHERVVGGETGLLHTVLVEGGHEQEACSQMLSDFFKTKRKKSKEQD